MSWSLFKKSKFENNQNYQETCINMHMIDSWRVNSYYKNIIIMEKVKWSSQYTTVLWKVDALLSYWPYIKFKRNTCTIASPGKKLGAFFL